MAPPVVAAIHWVTILVLGGLAGLFGQAARAAVGLKKRGDEMALKGDAAAEPFDGTRLRVSLLMGATAGVLAAIATSADLMTASGPTMQHIMGLMAAGYAGGDFIEGIVARFGFEKGG